jgi:hypothetical protein
MVAEPVEGRAFYHAFKRFLVDGKTFFAHVALCYHELGENIVDSLTVPGLCHFLWGV